VVQNLKRELVFRATRQGAKHLFPSVHIVQLFRGSCTQNGVRLASHAFYNVHMLYTMYNQYHYTEVHIYTHFCI